MSKQVYTRQARSRMLILIIVDFLCMLLPYGFFLYRAEYVHGIRADALLVSYAILTACVYACRFVVKVYQQMVRFANAGSFLRMILADAAGALLYLLIDRLLLSYHLPIATVTSAAACGLLLVLLSRFIYQWLRKNSTLFNHAGTVSEPHVANKINVAIVGAGELGVLLARELMSNRNSRYHPYCFFDNDPRKIGSVVEGLRVYGPDNEAIALVASMPIQEIIIAIPDMTPAAQKSIFNRYKQTKAKVMLYDYPHNRLERTTDKRSIRDINIEDLLFRSSVALEDSRATEYYRDRVVMVTGAGGSIGSELCRQIAACNPKQLVMLDIYENGVYEVQQELRRHFPQLDLRTKIASVCDVERLEQVFDKYRPEILFHAAAHKHVPLMEHNCAEAIVNNVFGTWNTANAAEKFGVKRFVLVSTDKAVNPTNIMGATKRACEMIILSRSDSKTTDFVAVRFGNVLGSNGSVVPLFRRQIAEGGPVTITDRRVVRYFMTIPEASQLVLRTGSRAEKSEIFVLDMGEPVRILDLAENLISLSGFTPYVDMEIKEIGLRPGEKLYEELLCRTDLCTKTSDDRIFIEHAQTFTRAQVDQMLDEMRRGIAAHGQSDQAMRDMMMRLIPTYRMPEVVNATAEEAEEMRSSTSRTHIDMPAPAGIPS